MIRCYTELKRLKTFEERFEYLKLAGKVGEETFGFDRYLNQTFYKSLEWKRIRNEVIIRDNGCDLGVDGYDIDGLIFIHHMNPISLDAITSGDERIINPEFLITTSFQTHNAMHYGGKDILMLRPADRKPGDTSLWRKMI